jgi:hypothetical protein
VLVVEEVVLAVDDVVELVVEVVLLVVPPAPPAVDALSVDVVLLVVAPPAPPVPNWNVGYPHPAAARKTAPRVASPWVLIIPRAAYPTSGAGDHAL